jgi:stearoyl-CoA desaturase (delta-9 desaturase)
MAATRQQVTRPAVPWWVTVARSGDAVGFVAVHLACLTLPLVGVTAEALVLTAVLYVVRCFGVCGGFHRGFAHRSYRSGRVVGFTFALLGTLALQRGVLWWVATHRRHHSVAETAEDLHSPHHRSLLYSHCGWFLDPANQPVDHARVRDLVRHRELVWLDRWKLVPVALMAAGLWLRGPAVFVWAFGLGTVVLWHATLSTGSFSHRVGGYRNFATPDDSRNNRVIAALLLGEGWHNNHHRHPRAALHGLDRHEPDPIGAVLRLLAALGLVHDLRGRPQEPALAKPTSTRASTVTSSTATSMTSGVGPAATARAPRAKAGPESPPRRRPGSATHAPPANSMPRARA